MEQPSLHSQWRKMSRPPILELDDPGTHHAFSKNMIEVYFRQAVDAFSRLDAALCVPPPWPPDAHTYTPVFALARAHPLSAAENLTELVDCAHFLAGSSATLGVARVAAACSHIEAAKVAEDSGRGSGREAACAQIRVLLAEARTSYAVAEAWLRRWYAECGAGFDDEPAIVEPVMATGSMTSTPVPVPETTSESRASAAAAKPRATDAMPPLPLQPSIADR
ncbi:hypothetical protein GGX14DRAFT_652878 [Mycena pura]|uniref:HPt domain-containing protein n=1 Tax=Mycena pura TaxID=153505 RepID=A0AAD6V4I3_9AGAR|nr:hypothetical protein GGX14DRAFT_652878 [Mycena pura]